MLSCPAPQTRLVPETWLIPEDRDAWWPQPSPRSSSVPNQNARRVRSLCPQQRLDLGGPQRWGTSRLGAWRYQPWRERGPFLRNLLAGQGEAGDCWRDNAVALRSPAGEAGLSWVPGWAPPHSPEPGAPGILLLEDSARRGRAESAASLRRLFSAAVPLLSALSAAKTDKYGVGGILSGTSHLKRVSGQVQRPASLRCNSWNPQEPPPGRARQLGVPPTKPL